MVLVVDDEAAITTLVRSVLEDEGFEARAVGNGRRALELLRNTPARLILLDMWMPVMNGWEFAAAYRQTPPPHAPHRRDDGWLRCRTKGCRHSSRRLAAQAFRAG